MRTRSVPVSSVQASLILGADFAIASLCSVAARAGGQCDDAVRTRSGGQEASPLRRPLLSAWHHQASAAVQRVWKCGRRQRQMAKWGQSLTQRSGPGSWLPTHLPRVCVRCAGSLDVDHGSDARCTDAPHLVHRLSSPRSHIAPPLLSRYATLQELLALASRLSHSALPHLLLSRFHLAFVQQNSQHSKIDQTFDVEPNSGRL